MKRKRCLWLKHSTLTLGVVFTAVDCNHRAGHGFDCRVSRKPSTNYTLAHMRLGMDNLRDKLTRSCGSNSKAISHRLCIARTVFTSPSWILTFAPRERRGSPNDRNLFHSDTCSPGRREPAFVRPLASPSETMWANLASLAGRAASVSGDTIQSVKHGPRCGSNAYVFL